MYAFYGEKNITILSEREKRISTEDFLPIAENYQIIFDKSDVIFSLEKLSCCSFVNALQILRCKKAALSSFEEAYLLPKKNFGIFQKTDFYLQTISLKNNGLSKINGIFLTENIIAEFCKTVTHIGKETWWLYAANHKSSGLRIVAGIGQGIILSRFLNADTDVLNEVLKTIFYLKRFGLKDPIKIITPLNEIKIHSIKNQPNIICEKLHLKKHADIETTLAEFLSQNKNIKKVFAKNTFLSSCLNKEKICKALYGLSAVCLLIAGIIHYNLQEEKNAISSIKRQFYVSDKNLSLSLNNNNFNYIKQCIELMRESRMPTEILKKTSEICFENKITVEQLDIENGSFVKIKTFLYKNKLEELQKNKGLKIEKNIFSAGDYEELLSNKKSEATICIK